MKPTKQTEAAILEAYHIFWEANLSADMLTFASYLVDDFSIFGSANGEEFFSKQETVEFYTATADELRGKAQLRNRNISVQFIDDNSVVVREQSQLYVLIENNWTFYGYARISCVLNYTGSRWMAVHQHASFPDHRTEPGQQLAAEKIEKENVELREAVQRRTVELEQKNRELEIEAAVERVRAQSMAMQQTSDIAKVTEALYQQLTNLKIKDCTGVAIYLVDEEEMVTVWDLSSPGSMGDASNYAFKYNPEVTPTLSEFIPIWRTAGQEYFIMDFPKEKLLMAAGELEPFYPAMAESFRNAISSGLLEHQWNATATISQGVLSLDMMKPPTEEVKSITLKMAAAFNLAYQRFHDLQTAEKQALRAEQDLLAIKESKQKAEEAFMELQAAQKQLIQSEKMASLGELTAGIAHEIQNPLNFVNNFSEVSKELLDEMREAIEKGDIEDAKEIMNDVIQNLEKINHHGKRADGIVKGMLQHSRSGGNQKEQTDINALADEYLRLSYHGLRAKDKSFNATLKADFDDSIGNINVISQDIGRVILNLITNAFYAVNEKALSAVAIRIGTPAAVKYEPTVSISTKKINDKIEIRVSDNGNGIPSSIKEKIFQPFFTTKPTGQGTGLGLSLAYDIVKAHGGELKVETTEGEGTEFIIYLPAMA